MRKTKNRPGFSLIELAVAMIMAFIVILTVGTVLVGSQRGWSRMYNRVYGDVVTDGYVARKTFDVVVRKSSTKRELLGDGEVELYYYSDVASPTRLDRYARFYKADEELLVDYGELDADGDPLGASFTQTLAHNVKVADFSVAGVCVKMLLRLDNGSEALTVMSSAVRYNE